MREQWYNERHLGLALSYGIKFQHFCFLTICRKNFFLISKHHYLFNKTYIILQYVHIKFTSISITLYAFSENLKQHLVGIQGRICLITKSSPSLTLNTYGFQIYISTCFFDVFIWVDRQIILTAFLKLTLLSGHKSCLTSSLFPISFQVVQTRNLKHILNLFN